MLPIRQIMQEMAAEKLRLGLTVLAIVWATLCIAFMLALGEGLRKGLEYKTNSGTGKLIQVKGGRASDNYGHFRREQPLTLKADDLSVVTSLPGVARAVMTVDGDENEKVRQGDHTTWWSPVAVSQGYQSLLNLKVMPQGRWFDPLDDQSYRQVAVLGSRVAEALFPSEEKRSPLGSAIKVGERDFTVIGVLQKGGGQLSNGGPIDYTVFVPFSTWALTHVNGDISSIDVEPARGVDRVQLAATLRQVLARKYGANPEDKSIVETRDLLLQQKTMRTFIAGLQVFLGLMGVITLIVAGVGIANVMVAMVKRATRDIGVRMAIGASPAMIRQHYLVQALVTVAIGGVIGLLLTLMVVQGIAHLPISGNWFYSALGRPKPVMSVVTVIEVVCALAVVGVLSALFPACQAARLTPLAALHSE